MTLNLSADLCSPEKIIAQEPKVNPNNWTNETTSKQTEAELLDVIMPKNDTIAWPLMYIWSSVLKIQDYIFTVNDTSSTSDHVMILVIRLWITILFVLVIVLLIVINLFRIVYLRFFVAFAPLIIILYFGNDDDKAGGIIEDFSIINIIKLIFAPVIATWLLSISLIVIVIMQQVLQSNNSYIQFEDGMTITSNKDGASIGSEWIFKTDIMGEIIPSRIKGEAVDTFSWLLMLMMTLAILRWITKALGMYMEWGIWGKAIEKATDMWSQLLWNIPMIPIWWWVKTGISSIMNQLSSIPKDMQSAFEEKERDKTRDIENRFGEIINNVAWREIIAKNITKEDGRIIKKAQESLSRTKSTMQNMEGFFNVSKKHNSSWWKYHNKRQALKDMWEFGPTIRSIFQHIGQNYSNDISRFDPSIAPGTSIERTSGDESPEKFEAFLTKNLWDGNTGKGREFKKLLTNIYSKMGGDSSTITKISWGEKIAKKFWSKDFTQTGEKENIE